LVTDAAWLAANGPTGAFSQGDGSTTFRIPDLRGEFIRGFDDGRGADAGRGIGTFQDGQLLSHGHAVTDPTHAHGMAGNNGGTAGMMAFRTACMSDL
jgi:microcystin-dependent protein